MKQFKDSQDRTWTIDLNVDSIEQVRALTEVNLYAALEGSLLEELGSNPKKLVDVVFALCEEQAKAKGVSDREFGKAMRGDAIDAATMALLEDLVDFFPQARRPTLRKILDKANQVQAKALAMATEAVDKLDVDDLLRETLKMSSGNAPESSAPIRVG